MKCPNCGTNSYSIKKCLVCGYRFNFKQEKRTINSKELIDPIIICLLIIISIMSFPYFIPYFGNIFINLFVILILGLIILTLLIVRKERPIKDILKEIFPFRENKILLIRWIFALIGLLTPIIVILLIFNTTLINDLILKYTILVPICLIGYAFLILSNLIPSEEHGLLIFNIIPLILNIAVIFFVSIY